MSLENTLTHQLERLISKADLNVTSEQISLLVRYVLLLDKWNKAYNLTSVRDPKEMLVKHIMDSLVISSYLTGESFIDVGTGPGLPGVPLAILNSDKRFTLVDSLGKRIRFLKQVQYDLGLENILPIQSRIEEYTEYTFDGIISRAFASLNDMLHWCDHLPNMNGAFYALKGDIEQSEINSIPPQYKLINNITLNVPELNAERRLIIITK